ncbi:MAG TPA: hypothetical protein VIQ76_11840 [Propionibacteriaceae bacterium]
MTSPTQPAHVASTSAAKRDATAYAWHAFISPPAFDSASIVVVRVSNVVFAALALAAVSIAARRISDKSE